MEPKSRESFEAPVREFEDRVLGYAVALVKDRARAEQIVEQAFAVVLTAPDRGRSLEARLGAATRRLAGQKTTAQVAELPPAELKVSRELHLGILDAVEDRQYTSSPANSRLIALGIAIVLIGGAGLVQLQRTRSEALAASVPKITSVAPLAGQTEVALDGEFLVQFGRMPAGTPTLQHAPPDGKQAAARWDGSNLIVTYTGLRLGVRYQLILEGTYTSRLHETGHFEKRWSFTAEGPPRLATTVPADGAGMVSRYGLISVDFSHRPPIDPVVTLQPAAKVSIGLWSGTTWTVHYSNLQPLTTYVADVTVASPDPAGRIHRAWTFNVESGGPPDGVPVIWYSTSSPWQSQSGEPVRLVAIDWSGRQVGTLYASSFGRQNPDGSWLSLIDGTGAMDKDGRVVLKRLFGGAVWSDVGNRYCDVGFDQNNAWSSPWLETGSVGGPVRRIASLAALQGVGSGGFNVLACSTATDRAVIGQQVQGGYLAVRVITLSTGRVVYNHSYSNEPQMLVASRDGRYLAESASGTGPAATVIHRLSDGAIVARLGNQRVVTFSWDGSLAITAPSWGKQAPGEIQLLDWRTGAVLWRAGGNPAATGQLPVYALAQPGGAAFGVGIGNPSGSGDADGLLLVHMDGHAEKVVSGSIFPAGYSG